MTSPASGEENITQIRIPEQFFRQALFEIKDLDELRLTLWLFWRLERLEGAVHYIEVNKMLEDSQLSQWMGVDPGNARSVYEGLIQKAVQRGSFLWADFYDESGSDKIICLNSPRGRALVDAIQRGEWSLTDHEHQPIDLYIEHPNIFQLYESNIGPLTPLIADALRDAETTYQADWIEEAFRIAVERNKRSWHYIEAILQRWQEGGRDGRKDKQDRRDTEEARRRYRDWEK